MGRAISVAVDGCLHLARVDEVELLLARLRSVCSGIRTSPASLVTALTPKPVMPKWWRTDFQVAGQSSLTGGIS